MAINPESQYPGQIAPSSPSYPFGQARNITIPGDGSGTPWEQALVNDIFGFQQQLLTLAGLTPSGTAERVGLSQYEDAIQKLHGATFGNVGAAIVADLKPGTMVWTAAYYSYTILPSPLSGGGVYVVVAPGDYSGTPDEIGAAFTMANGNILVLLHNGIITAEQFGAKTDGVTDALTSLTAAKVALDVLNGGKILCYGDIYLLSGLLTLDTNSVVFEGKGSGFFNNAVGAQPNSEFRRFAGSTDTVVEITSNGTLMNNGSGLRGIRINGSVQAANGLIVRSHNKVVLHDVYVTNATTVNVHFLAKPAMVDASSTQYASIDGLYVNSGFPDTGDAAADAIGVIFDGDTVGNFSLNQVNNLVVLHTNAAGIVMANCDNNEFSNVRVSIAVADTAANVGLTFGAAATLVQVARANHMRGVSAKRIFAQGTSVAAAASYNNFVEFDYENWGTIPVIDTGATLTWRNERSFIGPNVMQLDNGWYDCWGLETLIPFTGNKVVTLPITYDDVGVMFAWTTVRTTYSTTALGVMPTFASANNQITITNTDQLITGDCYWWVRGLKTTP